MEFKFNEKQSEWFCKFLMNKKFKKKLINEIEQTDLMKFMSRDKETYFINFIIKEELNLNNEIKKYGNSNLDKDNNKTLHEVQPSRVRLTKEKKPILNKKVNEELKEQIINELNQMDLIQFFKQNESKTKQLKSKVYELEYPIQYQVKIN